MTRENSDPCDGTAVHERVLEQFCKLTSDDGLLVQTVRHVKESNKLARSNNVMLRRANLLLFTYLLTLGILLALGWKSMERIQVAQHSMNGAVQQLDEALQRLSVLQKSLEAVKMDTKNIKEEQQAQPRVELVPEPDPVKARETPIKVRITPPSTSKAPPAPTVEVAIPAKDVSTEQKK